MSSYREKPLVAFIVPTGVGASVGGFAGDASGVAREFAKDFNLIVNPNVVNAACFSGITDNMLYTEGNALERFFKGEISLKPSKNNKIGIIFDKSITQGILNVHINTMNAVKTVYGLDIAGYEITDEPCCVGFYNTEEGISSGNVENPETMLRAAKKLKEKGAVAIAIVCKFDEPPEDDYENGNGVDIVGGVEAIISHYLSRELNMPVAHAPAFEDITISKKIVDARAAAEYITPSFLPCVLLGLKNAPLISVDCGEHNIYTKDVKALIMPYNSLGSSIVPDALKFQIPVFAVKENKTVLNITPEVIGNSEIISVRDYDKCKQMIKEMINVQ